MENVKETYNKSNSAENANNPSHYTLLAAGIFIAIFGVVARFLTTWSLIDVIANVILVIGALMCLKAVANILK